MRKGPIWALLPLLATWTSVSVVAQYGGGGSAGVEQIYIAPKLKVAGERSITEKANLLSLLPLIVLLAPLSFGLSSRSMTKAHAPSHLAAKPSHAQPAATQPVGSSMPGVTGNPPPFSPNSDVGGGYIVQVRGDKSLVVSSHSQL